MTIENLALFLPGQRVEDFSQMPARLSEQHLAPSLAPIFPHWSVM